MLLIIAKIRVPLQNPIKAQNVWTRCQNWQLFLPQKWNHKIKCIWAPFRFEKSADFLIKGSAVNFVQLALCIKKNCHKCGDQDVAWLNFSKTFLPFIQCSTRRVVFFFPHPFAWTQLLVVWESIMTKSGAKSAKSNSLLQTLRKFLNWIWWKSKQI